MSKNKGPYVVEDRGWGLSITGGPAPTVFYSRTVYGNVINEICWAMNLAHESKKLSARQKLISKFKKTYE